MRKQRANYSVANRAVQNDDKVTIDFVGKIDGVEFAGGSAQDFDFVVGQKQMLAVARAMVEPRDLLVIDEPSKGLAPAIVDNMIHALRQLKDSGVTVLLVEQNMHFAQQLGDSVAVMDNGRVVHAGRMQALAQDAVLQKSLLGLAL